MARIKQIKRTTKRTIKVTKRKTYAKVKSQRTKRA